jgi:hypothetical protein
MIPLPPTLERSRRPLPRWFKVVLVALALVLVAQFAASLAEPLIIEGAVKGTVRGEIVKTEKAPVSPAPTFPEVVLGEDIGSLSEGGTVWIRCRTAGEFKLVRRPPLFRSRSVEAVYLEPDEPVNPC